MKDPSQIMASIERFKRGFWGRERIDHPPVGISPNRGWLPIGYLKGPFEQSLVMPSNVTPALIRTDYEDASLERHVVSDDWLPYNAAWRAVPWLEAMCGCGVRYSTGSLAPQPVARSMDELVNLGLPANPAWYDCLRQQTRWLVENTPPDGWVSPTILRGPSDVLAGLRGLTDFYLDLHDAPRRVAQAADQVNQVLMDVLDMHYALVSPRLGGYGYIYGYWSPGPTVVLQEDMLGMCSPQVYADLFMENNARVVEHLGAYTFFHLHSSGLRHYRHVMSLSGLAGLEITVEANGPSLQSMLPMLREILERTRLILFVDDHFEELANMIGQLPSEGLYLIISDKFINAEQDYSAFIAAHWSPHRERALPL